MNLKKQIYIYLALILILLPSHLVQAQVRRLTPWDKSQIVKSILRQENFKGSTTWNENAPENTVYLLAENISPEQVPQIKGIKFVLISQAQVEEMKKTGVEYYRFSEFDIRKTLVRVFLTREYMNPRNSNASTMVYTCRKISGRWRVKGRIDGVGVGESN